jgi:peptidoglycan-N-acetylglucosamine deacetylase
VERNVTGPIVRVITKKPVAALTFDDGPDPTYTPKVLEVLKTFNARSTFFMLGECGLKHPELVKRVAADGHAIGNHSWSHSPFNTISLRNQQEELVRTQKTLSPYAVRLFRPPYGLTNFKANISLFMRGYKNIFWSFSSEDWYERDPQGIKRSVIENLRYGSIILFHDRIFNEPTSEIGPKLRHDRIINRETMLLALESLLEEVDGKLTFVTIPSLLEHGRPVRRTS